MHSETITEYRPEYPPAYLANGLVGLRVGRIPLPGGTALLGGYMGTSDLERVESYLPVPYPVGGDVRVGEVSLSQRPDLAVFREQAYDLATGELLTRFDFPAAEATAAVEVLTLASRTAPAVVLQEVRVRVDKPCSLALRAMIDPAGIPGECLLRDVLNPGWDVVDGCLHWQARGGKASCGAAYTTEFIGEGKAEKKRGFWGYSSTLYTDYALKAEPGREYVLRTYGGLVPSVMHAEPDRQAIRLVGMARTQGFEALRQANREAWADLWKGRVRLLGADERWQRIADACYFYLHSSMHPSMPCSVGAWGLSVWQSYMGHVFWDCETFVFPVALLTAPHSARAMLDYRTRLLQGARFNAALNGYRGVQFPWESGTHGGETIAAWCMGIFTEQHVNLDVAFAFAQFAHATGDDLFIRRQAWPVLAGVAEWIASRGVWTERGYEIRCATGIDEGKGNVDNAAYLNMASVVVLEEAMAMAGRLGLRPPPEWAEIARLMYVPRDPATGAILKFDGYKYEGGVCCPDPLAALFPMTYKADPKVEAATLKFYMDLAHTFLGVPMLSALLGVFAARGGNRKFAQELFEGGIADFVVPPFTQVIEWVSRAPHPKPVPRTVYMANMGGFLMSCLYGLPGIQLDSGRPEEWGKFPVVMPEGWDGVEVERMWVRGRPAHLTARHGDKRARIEME